VTEAQSGSEADAVVSRDPTRLLTVRVADCVPLLIADRRTGAVAAVHAGWRGTASRIAPAVVGRMHDEFGTAPEDIVAAIGPSIRACCYEVGPELVDAFREAGASDRELADWFSPRGASDRLVLDVARATRDQLAAAGVPDARILDSGLCTCCHRDLFHSYRRDQGLAGRMVGFIRAGTGSV
jgi:YfiH family protein